MKFRKKPVVIEAIAAAREEGHAAAVASLVAAEGCVVDSDGVVRRVLGTLPVTADGVVVADEGPFKL